MTSERGSVMKELHKLLRNSDKLYDGQVEFVLDDGEKDTLTREEKEDEGFLEIFFYVTANEGLYRNARIKFKMRVSVLEYPSEAPKITCMNRVYHPNIDDELYDDGAAICVSLLDDEWEPKVGLDGAVMAVLFLLHNPQLDDFLNGAFHDDYDNDEYEANLRRSLRGEDIGDSEFDKLLDDTEDNRDGEGNGCKDVAENTGLKNKDGAGAAASPDDVLVNVDLAHKKKRRFSAFKLCYPISSVFSSIRAFFKNTS